MKKILLILSLFLVAGTSVFAQDDDDQEGNEKIRDKMNEYVQKKLGLSGDESKKFSPVFLQYFKEWRQTARENRNDKLVRQQKVAELRVNYRTKFRDAIGEQRGNQVFTHVDAFILELRKLRRSRQDGTP
jgi:hypothetical protein